VAQTTLEVGVEQVERWPLNEQRQGDPLKIKWTEDWLVGKLIERKAAADRAQDVQNWWTRGLSIAAIVVSLVALWVSYYIWTHPQPVPAVMQLTPNK
jgi:hypothetical protein